MPRTTIKGVAAVLLATAATVPPAACGSSSDNKPAYCKQLDTLKSDVGGLKDVKIGAGALSSVQTQLTKIQGDAKDVIASAKSDFPDQTQAMQTSLDSLSSSLKTATSSPNATSILAVGTAASSLVSSVQAFTDATKDKC